MAADARDHVIAIDQGTTSTRVMVFDPAARPVAIAQREHRQIFEHPGWVGHDAAEIWRTTRELILEALGTAAGAGVGSERIASIGITNQRETTVVWDAATGEPVAHAIVWQDTRTQPIIDALAAQDPRGTERLRDLTGLPLASYFAASKVRWILDEVPGAAERAEAGGLRFGTIDSWLVWNLTGGDHLTDATNASRTLLMDLRTLEWSGEALELFGIPASMLPRIVPSSGVCGEVRGIPGLEGVPIAGILGDQQAATFGQAAFSAGEAKHTFGTGGFLIVNTGEEVVHSRNGLISTVAYQREGESPVYAVEGSVAVAGSLHHWLRDNLGLFADSGEIEGIASSVPDTGGAFIVPAFSGLFAPHWEPDARGVIVGLTRFVTRAHLVRAASEACAYQTVEVIEAAAADTGARLAALHVDGGGSESELMMQFQADLLGVDVVRPEVLETTALGAAFAAGLAVGVWGDLDALRGLVREGRRWAPTMADGERALRMRLWAKAVERSRGWVDDDVRELIDRE